MTRLESSARDYAIARLSAGEDLWPVIRDYRGPEYEAAVHAWEHCYSSDDLRLVRARVALYLRLLRRVEAWERGGPFNWAEYQPDGAVVLNGRVIRDEETADILHQYDGGELRGFVPLWTLAAPHEPGVTARMRRGRLEALGREAPGPEVVT